MRWLYLLTLLSSLAGQATAQDLPAEGATVKPKPDVLPPLEGLRVN